MTLTKIGSLLPKGSDVVRLEVEDGKLRIGTLRLPCEWTAVTEFPIELKAQPDLLQLLAIKKHYSDAEIRESRIEALVERAVARGEELLEKAAKPLADLGITAETLRALVEQQIPDIAREDNLSGFRPPQANLSLDTDAEQLGLGGE